jgi:galactonate dehydratase
MGSPVNTAAFVQLDAAIPNYVLQESNLIDEHPLNEIVERPLVLDQGYVVVPDGPGIGVEVREEAFSRFPYEPRAIAGTFRADGSVSS